MLILDMMLIIIFFVLKYQILFKNHFVSMNIGSTLKEYGNAVLTRKRDNIEGWKLLGPWVDLRNKIYRKKDYDHFFNFGVIKYRIKRNPQYYALHIVLPLFLMGCC